MNEYQIKYKVWDTGGFLPDLFGKELIHIINKDTAQEAKEEFDLQMGRAQFYNSFIYKIKEIIKI